MNSNDVEAQFACAICKILSWMLPAVLQEEIGKISNWGLTFDCSEVQYRKQRETDEKEEYSESRTLHRELQAVGLQYGNI